MYDNNRSARPTLGEICSARLTLGKTCIAVPGVAKCIPMHRGANGGWTCSLALLLVVAFNAAPAPAQAQATVTGRVIDE